MASRKFTNNPELLALEPDAGWEFVENAQKPSTGTFAPGATEPTVAGGSLDSANADISYEAASPPDPRLGVNRQGEWSPEKMQRMFPEMFIQPEEWLDPAEEAKRLEGKPYDKTKKYDPSKPIPGLDVIRGGRPEPLELRTDRATFEDIVFQKIGGNPFLLNPYKKLVEADKRLPELFDKVFQGRATLADLPKLSKEERKVWEDAKKLYHSQIYEAAKAEKEQMMNAYKWMMGNFEADQKEKKARWAESEKERIRQETIRNKAPQLRAVQNDSGVVTIHAFYPDGRIVDTGKATGAQAFANRMPQHIKDAMAYLKQFKGDIDPEKEMLISIIGQSNPALAESMRQAHGGMMSPEMRESVKAVENLVNRYFADLAKQIISTGQSVQSAQGQQTQNTTSSQTPVSGGTVNANATQPAKSATGPATATQSATTPQATTSSDLRAKFRGRSPEAVIGLIANEIKKGKPGDQYIKDFLNVISGHRDYNKYLNMLSKATKTDVQTLSRLTNPPEEENKRYRINQK